MTHDLKMVTQLTHNTSSLKCELLSIIQDLVQIGSNSCLGSLFELILDSYVHLYPPELSG